MFCKLCIELIYFIIAVEIKFSGTEWYERTILNTRFIMCKLKDLEIDYRLLMEEEINTLNRKMYDKHYKKK